MRLQALALLGLCAACAQAAGTLSAPAVQAAETTDSPAAPAGAAGLSLRQAAAAALERNSAILGAGLQVRISQANALAAQGPFDWQFNGSLTAGRTVRKLTALEKSTLAGYTGVPADNELTFSESTQAAVGKLFESGLSPSLGFTADATRDRLLRLEGFPDQRTNVATFSLTLPLAPLGRNNGTIAVETRRGLRQESLAAQQDLRQTVSQVVLAVVQKYWECIARAQQLDAARAAEARVALLARETEKLIAADQLPAAERQLVLASLAEHRSSTLAAALASEQSRRDLALLLGSDAADAYLGTVLADPIPDASAPLDQLIGATDAGAAIMRRPEVLAAQARLAESESRLRAAAEARKPAVDLTLSAGYAALHEGDSVGFTPTGAFVDQPTAAATLSMQIPFENSAARGAEQAAALAAENSRVDLAQARRAAGNGLAQALAALRTASATLEKAADAEARYKTAVENERTKRRLGLSTLIDVITIEDRYAAAVDNLVQARQARASAVARWYYEQALLVEVDQERLLVRTDLLFQ
ncbi:MAG: TolC family protein [Nevskia sp.]|nr:TolC family protein [Nevskia sp.]